MEVHKETDFLRNFCYQMSETACPYLEAFQIDCCKLH
uniref:LRR receptor-like serine/threonine-protein kinase GSO1 n=1 Tax=Rhizophora mucronata TaxID=61149 RepID=A0A2P2IZV8_RHIMU